MTVSVRPVRSSKDLKTFIHLPRSIYRGDTNFTPQPFGSEKRVLDRNKNPFFKHAEAEYFLAEKDGKPVGRIAAIKNDNHIKTQNEKAGFFGFFESIRDPDVFHALFQEAEKWLKEKGMEKIKGPANPSLNDPCGFVIEGFNWPAFILMTYNPRYYPDLIQDQGYVKCMDMFAYLLLESDYNQVKVDRVAEIVKKRTGATVRNMNPKKFDEELRVLMEIYNDAWKENWGFSPMTEDEILFAANDMKPILLPELTWVAEVEGKPVGFALGLPDVNQALRKCNGKLFPFGWWRFLPFNLRKIPTYRIVALGVKQQYLTRGIGTLFYQKYMEETTDRYRAAECSWILENNPLMNRPLEEMGAKIYKTYRLYEKSLTP